LSRPSATQGGPTVPPPGTRGLAPALERNIRALQRRHQQEQAASGFHQRLAATITAFTGSMAFVYLHVAVFGAWIVANLGWLPWLPRWDPSFVILAMVASVEAIFLSTFVLISQNRMAQDADRRADLDLQVSLLAEHEVTKLAVLVSAIAERLGVSTDADKEMDELKREIAPEAVLDKIEESKGGGQSA
jgi:uncharacterized membrane protein